MLKFQNTLTGTLEEFTPLDGNNVRLYICGPTVWSFAHIGNFRTFIFGDILRRYLKYKGYNLTHAMNLTDVDDRIINEARKAGKTIDEFTAPFIEAFWEDADALGLERPEIAPRATATDGRAVLRRVLGRCRRARFRATGTRAARDRTHCGDDFLD